MDIPLLLISLFRGRHVGTDGIGNRYFIDRRTPRPGTRARRWVAQASGSDAADIPAQWQAWLRHDSATALAPRRV